MSSTSNGFLRRRQLLRKSLKSKKLNAMLIVAEKNVTWLTGFTGDSTWLLVTEDSEVILSDSRFETQIQEECPGLKSCIRSSTQKLTEILTGECQRLGIETCGFEGHVLTVETADVLKTLPAPQQWFAINWEVEQLRAIKDKDEITEIREAVRLAERGFEVFKSILTPSRTERELAAELEHAMRGFGATGCSFPAIVAVGNRAALPHYRPGNIRLSESPILLLDWGARTRSGYVSDLTRTLLTGKADKTFEKVYKTVLAAQQEAISMLGPGVRCGDVDAVARQIIHKTGYGKHFGHGLGHGIGLDVHEMPRLSSASDTILKPGMVVTVEPGIYLPDWGGVRIEDDVLITKNGYEVLSSVPKDWASVTVAC